MQLDRLWWQFAIVIVCSYLFGNINSAIIISKIKKRDIREIGSGNPGTMNMSRVFGMKIGLLVFVLDLLKGVIPTVIARVVFAQTNPIDGQPVWAAAELCAAFFVVMGHVFPVFYGFKGGKGIASSIGALVVVEWKFTLIFCACALAFIFITKIGSMGSFVATAPSAAAAAIRLYFDYGASGAVSGYYVIANVLLFALIFLTWFAHRVNIVKLLSGEEHDTNWWQMIKDSVIKLKYGRNKAK